jgi:transposase
MFTLGGGTKIYLATGVTDLRRSFSLYTIIEHRLGFAQRLNGDIFGFVNRRHNLVKLFWFSEGGVCIFSKRLPESTFRWPQAGEKTVPITAGQLQLLLSGIDLKQTRARKWWRRESITATTNGA